MINSLILKNFQSHKHTSLEFSPGVNAIIGASDKGKTAILRGLYWIVYNRPSGTKFVSRWAKDGKKIKDGTVVKIIKNNKEIQRLRTNDFNGYAICQDEKPICNLEAIKTDVPEEISNILNLSEVNIQKQLDSPFLVGDTAGEVARFFNKTIKLDIIDRALSCADGRKRDYKKQLEGSRENVESYRKELEKLSWIDEVNPLIEDAEKLEDRLHKKKSTTEFLNTSLESYNEINKVLQEWEKVISLENKVNEIISIDKEKTDLINKKYKMEISLLQYEKQKKKADVNVEPVEELYTEIISINDRLTKKKKQKAELKSSLEEFTEFTGDINKYLETIKTLEAKLPEVCPMCNGTGRLK